MAAARPGASSATIRAVMPCGVGSGTSSVAGRASLRDGLRLVGRGRGLRLRPDRLRRAPPLGRRRLRAASRAASASSAMRIRRRLRRRRSGQHQRLDHPGDALVLERRGDVPGDRPDGGRSARHRRAVTDLGEHLDVVPLVADRQGRAELHPETARQPADGSALGHARRDELEELRVADRDVRRAQRTARARAARPRSGRAARRPPAPS